MNNVFRFLWLFFLLLGIVVLPLAYFSPFVLEYEFTKFVVFYFFGTVLLFFLGRHFLTGKQTETPTKRLTIPLAFFLTIYVVATVFSLDKLTSLLGFFGSFTGGLIYLFFLLVFFFSSFVLREDRKIILQTIFLSGVLVGVYGLWQYSQNYWFTHQFVYRIYSTIGQPNRLAFFLLAVLPIGVFLIKEEKQTFLKVFSACGLVVTLAAFFLTFSRSAYAVLLVTLLLIVYSVMPNLFRKKVPCSFRHPIAILKQIQNDTNKRITVLIFLFTLVCFLLFGFTFARTIPSTISNFSQSSLSLRLAEWRGSWGAVVNRPLWRQLVGYGPETVYFTFFKYRPLLYNQSSEEISAGPSPIRNYYLHLLSGIGLLGLLAYLLSYQRLLKLSWEEGQKDPLILGVFFSFVAIAIYSFFYYQTDTVLPIFWILAGVVVANYCSRPKAENYFSDFSLRSKNKYITIIKTIGGLLLFIVPISIFILIRVVLAHYYASRIPSETNFVKATQLAPFFDVYQRSLSRLYMSEMLAVKDIDKKQALDKFLLSQKAAQKALNISPLDIRNVRQLVLIKYYAGVNLDKKYQKENIFWAKKLTQLSPSDYQTWDVLGLVYLNIGDLKRAKTVFLQEKSLKDDVPVVWLHLGEVAKQEGNIDRAIGFYNIAIKLAPGWDFAQNELNKALVIKNSTVSAKIP